MYAQTLQLETGEHRVPVNMSIRPSFRFSSLRANSRLAAFLGLAAVLMVAGCHRAPSPDVMATVNGKTIVRADLDKIYTNTLGESQQKPSPEQADLVRLQILRQMIEDEILQQRATKLNLVATDEDVNAKLTEMKSPYTQEEFDRQLKQHGITLDDLKRDLRRNLTKNKLLNKEIESKINVTDGEISGYYMAHKAEFNLIEPQYHLAQIVVTGTPSQQAGNQQNNKASNDAEARKKIEALHSHLVNGEDFGAVAMNFSENPNNASNGGDMGFIPESQLRSEQETFEAIGKLKPGQITDVITVSQNNGSGRRAAYYAVYKLISREAAGQREINDPRVRQTIRQMLHDAHTQLLKSAYSDTLHNQAKVQNYFAEQILKAGAH